MAVWQCDIFLVPRSSLPCGGEGLAARPSKDAWKGRGLAEDYPARLAAAGLARGRSWTPRLEVWGSDEGDRFDVFRIDNHISSVLARIDMRRPNIEFVTAIVDIARDSGCVGFTDSGQIVESAVEAFAQAMRTSRAAQFVEDPRGFIDQLAARRSRS